MQGEMASAISMAHDSNWSLPYLEEQIKQHKGDVNAIFHEVGPATNNAPHESFRRCKAFLESESILRHAFLEHVVFSMRLALLACSMYTMCRTSLPGGS